MTTAGTDAVLEGAPRRNGSLVFDEPWQARAFGVALTLAEERGLSWDGFRAQLMAAIARSPRRAYWESWLVALENWVSAEVLAPAPAHGAAPSAPH